VTSSSSRKASGFVSATTQCSSFILQATIWAVMVNAERVNFKYSQRLSTFWLGAFSHREMHSTNIQFYSTDSPAAASV
jgi:hypothetical protein